MTQTPKKLLIIDDEAELREVLVALLDEHNLEIVLAANGQEGIQKLREGKFDAILSDEKMPKKNGLEVLRWMHQEGLKTPFIIHTGYGERAMISEAERLGVFAFIDKPWDERILIQIVREALEINLEARN
jgi:DNA-binding NtrC family response regulator